MPFVVKVILTMTGRIMAEVKSNSWIIKLHPWETPSYTCRVRWFVEKPACVWGPSAQLLSQSMCLLMGLHCPRILQRVGPTGY